MVKMTIKNYLIKNKENRPVGIISIYRFIEFKKLTKFAMLDRSRVLTMLKKEQFDNLDNLINDTLEKLDSIAKNSTNNVEQLKYQNKYKGLKELKKKIYLAKNDYLNNPSNQLAFNKLINLYNSSKNFL